MAFIPDFQPFGKLFLGPDPPTRQFCLHKNNLIQAVMKNNLPMLLLLISLVSQTGNAQQTFKPETHPYTGNLPATMVLSLRQAGFDLPDLAPMAGSKTNTVAERNVLSLDSTLSFVGYDSFFPEDSVLEVRTLFFSDDQHRLTGSISAVFDPESQSYKPDRQLKIFPHGDSPELIDSILGYRWDPGNLDWKLVRSHRNFFDPNDRLLETRAIADMEEDPREYKEIYSYDAQGDNHLIDGYWLSGNNETQSSRTELKYVDHRPIEVLQAQSDGLVFHQKTRLNYAYTLFGAVRKKMHFEWNKALDTWTLFQTIDYAYDQAQRLSTKTTSHNTLEKRDLVSYAYVSGQNLYLEMYFNWDDDLFDWVLVGKKYYYYQKPSLGIPHPLAAEMLRISPNPTLDLARLDLDEPAQLQIFNTQGAMVHSGAYSPGHSLNLFEFPSGLYFITAKTEDKTYAGRILKQ